MVVARIRAPSSLLPASSRSASDSFGSQSELEGDVAELNVEIDQAAFAAVRRFVAREADRELRQKRRGADPAVALDEADELRIGRVDLVRTAVNSSVSGAIEVSTSSKLSGNGMTSCAPDADQRTDERQRRLV